MNNDSANISTLLYRMYGIDISKYKVSFLNRSLQNRITETHCSTIMEYYTVLEQDNNEGNAFLDSLNNNYSEFYRNSLTFSTLEHIILPSLLQKRDNTKRKEIRIWSAASAAGQEAYSLAILLEELINSDHIKLNYRIFATDQSEARVIEAQTGVYSATTLNKLNMKRAKQWLTKHPTADSYTVKPKLKKNIDFSVFDMLSDQLGCPSVSIFGDFDMVVCANLLFYYKPEYQKIILGKATNCLANEGYIIVGETERDILLSQNYLEAFPKSAIFKKATA